MGLLFQGEGDEPPRYHYRHAPYRKSLLFQPEASQERHAWMQRHNIVPAATSVIADFQTLQAIWRKAATSRLTTRREEGHAWARLIDHLTKLPRP
jgi:hypothetical protein